AALTPRFEGTSRAGLYSARPERPRSNPRQLPSFGQAPQEPRSAWLDWPPERPSLRSLGRSFSWSAPRTLRPDGPILPLVRASLIPARFARIQLVMRQVIPSLR